MNCSNCIAHAMAQTAMNNSNAALIASRAIDTCRELRAAHVCDAQPATMGVAQRVVLIEAPETIRR